MPADFERLGYTIGCPGCVWMQNKLGARRGHNNECRARMEAALIQDEDGDGKIRMQAQKEKIDQFVAAEGEDIMKEADKSEPNETNEPNAQDKAAMDPMDETEEF